MRLPKVIETLVKLIICSVCEATLQWKMFTQDTVSGQFFVLGGDSVISVHKWHRSRNFVNLEIYSFARRNNTALRIGHGIKDAEFCNITIGSWRAKQGGGV